MPRTLPWLKNASDNSTKPISARPFKRQKILDPVSADESSLAAHPRSKAVSRAARTPSTSPPPEPPSQELMRPGLLQDDIYVMVEDEFHAVARTFTQHLHHAEYLRLKELAKKRSSSSISPIPLNIHNNQSITALRAETKKKKEADMMDANHKAALKQLYHVRRPGSNEDEDEIADNGGNWKGTPLQGFMTTSPRKNENSLIGLGGIKASTRAAAGYSGAKRKPTYASAKSFNLAPERQSERRNNAKLILHEERDDGEDEDDDLDAPVTKPQLHALPSQTAAKSLGKNYNSKPALSTAKSSTPSSSLATEKSNPNFPKHARSAAAIQQLGARLARKEIEKSKPVAAESGNVYEIPVFLV